MPGRVNDLRFERSPAQYIALLEQLIHFRQVGRQDAEKCSLHFHGLIKRQIVAVHQNRRSGILVQLA
jgi:hypothetical protein